MKQALSKLALSGRTNDLGLFLMRAMLCTVFVFHGGQKLFGIFGGHGLQGMTTYLDSLGFPLPYASAVMAGGTEFFGGIALLLGFFGRTSALLLSMTMFVAAFTHSGFSSQAGGMEYPLTLAVVSLGLALSGMGRLALRPLGGRS